MQERKQKQREAIRQEAARRNITITTRGLGYELKGVGVSLMVLDLAHLTSGDLVPFVSRADREARA
jgi:hypothetical protein